MANQIGWLGVAHRAHLRRAGAALELEIRAPPLHHFAIRARVVDARFPVVADLVVVHHHVGREPPQHVAHRVHPIEDFVRTNEAVELRRGVEQAGGAVDVDLVADEQQQLRPRGNACPTPNRPTGRTTRRRRHLRASPTDTGSSQPRTRARHRHPGFGSGVGRSSASPLRISLAFCVQQLDDRDLDRVLDLVMDGGWHRVRGSSRWRALRARHGFRSCRRACASACSRRRCNTRGPSTGCRAGPRARLRRAPATIPSGPRPRTSLPIRCTASRARAACSPGFAEIAVPSWTGRSATDERLAKRGVLGAGDLHLAGFIALLRRAHDRPEPADLGPESPTAVVVRPVGRHVHRLSCRSENPRPRRRLRVPASRSGSPGGPSP